MPKGYTDITPSVDVRGLDLLNNDSDFSGARALFADSAPGAAAKDWVESDTDAQLMLYVPFQATLKIHTLHLTSLPGADGTSSRPRTIHLYTNRAHVLGFEEAEATAATQTVRLAPADWDAASGTASVELRFVKFQNVSSLVLFVADAEEGADGEEADRTRLDRVRFVGDTGERREMGKLEKIGDQQGE